ncbi:conserved hypothetical protein [Ricinus communis]|uniref:Retrotransposon gag domain-containing protein n=1 Tax=Ricinus communis TaxID=3988 RepID=B9SJ15_RICCO|nr:conserved hypothetical protein [Ricinus communis]
MMKSLAYTVPYNNLSISTPIPPAKANPYWKQLTRGIPDDQKIDLATLFLREKADIWYQGWQVQNIESTWDECAEELCKRFAELTVEDVVEEINKMKQKGIVVVPGET